MEKKPMFRVTRNNNELNFCVFPSMRQVVESELSNGEDIEAGDVVKIECVMLTDDEYEALGDFEGY